MNRYRTYGPGDDPSEMLGDVAFKVLDMRTDAATLTTGTVRRSENFRFDQHGAQVRGGIARQLPAGASLPIIRYVGIYRPDKTNDRLALVTERSLILFNPADQTLAQFDYPAGETVLEADPRHTIQAGISSGTTPYLWILRGFAKDALKFDGASIVVDSDFKRAEWGLFYGDRIGVNDTRQSFWVSAYLDYTTWDALNNFQIDKGGEDFLVGALPYQIGNLDVVILTCRKRFLVAYFNPQLGDGTVATDTTSFLRGLTREAGAVNREAIIEAAGMVWFISDNGVYAFQPTLDLQLTVLGQPLSAPIQPIMDQLSANYAGGAAIQRLGHRLYFAMPINPDPIALSSVVVATGGGQLTVPFTLPAVLDGSANLATFESATAHNLASGDLVQVFGAMDAGLNGVHSVVAAPDSTHFTVPTSANPEATLGVRAKLQQVVTRNNRIAVYNLVNQGWESVDTLPPGIFADWLRVCDHCTRRRLWIIDRVNGPALYEEGDVDETSGTVGGLRLPFTLDAQLSAANYQSAPINGRLVSRTLRWGPFARHVKAGEARLTVAPGDAGTVTTRVNTPGTAPWEDSRDFDGTGEPDIPVRKRCGKRGLEAELEVLTTAGRPTVRELQVETVPSGRVKEE